MCRLRFRYDGTMRAKALSTLYVLLWVVLFAPTTDAQMQVESEEHFRVPLSSSVKGNVWATPVWTHRDSIFLTCINPDQELVLHRYRPGRALESTVIHRGVKADNHHGPSMGIDAAGFIHITGDQHNGAPGQYIWNYWVSDRPHDGTAFTFRGGRVFGPEEERTYLPGGFPTYSHFYRHADGRLFAAYRGRVLGGDPRPGFVGMQLARLDRPGHQRWVSLGVEAPDPDPWPVNTIGWIANGKWDHDFYQTYRMQLVGDSRGWMHAAWTIYGPESRHQQVHDDVGSGATHVVYARSRDGEQWFDLQGRRLRLPIGIDQPSAVVHESNPGDLTSTVSVTLAADGRPIVSYRRGGVPMLGRPYMKIADRHGRWSEERPLPPGNLMVWSLRTGELVTSGESGEWFASRDDGRTWTQAEGRAYVDVGENASLDRDLFRRTGILRIATAEQGDDGWEMVVRTIRFERSRNTGRTPATSHGPTATDEAVTQQVSGTINHP